MPNIDKKYLNPDGTIKPLNELIGEYRHNAGSVTLSPETRPSWFNSDGSPKPDSQIRAERAQLSLQKERIQEEVRVRTERGITKEDKTIRGLTERIEHHEDEARYMPPAQAREARQFINKLKAERQAIEDTVTSAAKAAEFAARPEIVNAKAYASTYTRTLPPGCTPEQAAVLIALSERSDCTVEEYRKAFWQQAEEIEISVHAAREKIVAERREGYAREAAALAEAERALNESRARHQQLHPPSVVDAVHDAQQNGTDLRESQ
jgi:hypothetical protein